MTTHKYNLGESVKYVRGSFEGNATTGIFVITRLMPTNGPDPEYRVKSANEVHERAMRESQLQRTERSSFRSG